jgi:hypothetical protein
LSVVHRGGHEGRAWLIVLHFCNALKAKTPGQAGRFLRSGRVARYCGFACAETALLDAMTGCPFS